MDQSFSSQVRHLYEVEGLSMRQIAEKLGVSRKKVSRAIRNEGMRRTPRESILKPYERLIEQCYQDYPMLKASQLYERLRSYGFQGSYATVALYSQRYRQKKKTSYKVSSKKLRRFMRYFSTVYSPSIFSFQRAVL